MPPLVNDMLAPLTVQLVVIGVVSNIVTSHEHTGCGYENKRDVQTLAT